LCVLRRNARVFDCELCGCAAKPRPDIHRLAETQPLGSVSRKGYTLVHTQVSARSPPKRVSLSRAEHSKGDHGTYLALIRRYVADAALFCFPLSVSRFTYAASVHPQDMAIAMSEKSST
jgi:hypothetical protein